MNKNQIQQQNWNEHRQEPENWFREFRLWEKVYNVFNELIRREHNNNPRLYTHTT